MLGHLIQAAIATLLLSSAVQAQLTCASPADASLGATQTATLLPFPAFSVGAPCIGTQTIHLAVYHRFPAPEDGWYSLHVIPTDAGSATLRIARIGSTLMDGAQPLTLGNNAFTVAAREPALPYAGACGWYSNDRMGNASRFSFVPPKTGTYGFSFCSSGRERGALSASPDLPVDTLITDAYGCPNGGGRLTAALTAGTTFYLAAGHDYANYDACSTPNATVEFIPPCPADLNDDDVVNGADLGTMLVAWGTPDQDITGDGTTNGVDLGILLASWGPCPN